MSELYIAGAGGLGRETYDVALTLGLAVAGFLDDHRAGTTVRGLPVLAPDEVSGGEYVIGIADPAVRGRLAAQLGPQGLTATSVVHPRATIAPETTYQEGFIGLANAYVSSSVRIGRHCQVHYNATIGHDSVLGDGVSVFPGANVSGSVQLADDVTIGSNAVVLQGLTVGTGAFVGAGAVVTRDVDPHTVVAGSPARPLPPRFA